MKANICIVKYLMKAKLPERKAFVTFKLIFQAENIYAFYKFMIH